MERRLAPLFIPAGKFAMHTLSKIVLVTQLMTLPSLGSSRMFSAFTLLIWVTHIIFDELERAVKSWRTWRTDVLHSVELLSALLTAMGILLRLHIRGPRTIKFLTVDLVRTFSPSHLLNKLMHPFTVPLGYRDPFQRLDEFLTDSWHTPPWEEQLSQSIIAGGVGLLTLVEWCRILQRSANFGPLVLMAIEMITESTLRPTTPSFSPDLSAPALSF